MATWQEDARRAALAHGLDPDWFTRQMGQEAHGDDLTSPAGAQGPAQFMPGTARSVGLNSTTVHQRVPSYNAAAKLMAGYVKKYGSVQDALVAYNAGPGRVGDSLPAETQGYIRTILGGSNPSGTLRPVRNAGSSATPTGSAPAISATADAPQLDAGQAGDFTSLLTSLLTQPQQQAAPSPIAPPSFAAAPPLPQGFTPAPGSSPPAPGQQDRVSAALSLVGGIGGSGSSVGSPGASETADGALAAQPIAEHVQAQRSGAPKIAGGTTKFDGKIVAAWIAPALKYARQHGWKGAVNSGFRSFEEQTRIYNSGVRPAAKPGTSNHEGDEYPRGAVDVSQAAQLAAILKGSPYAKRLVWAGAKDPVHFSHPHGGSY